MRCLIVDDSSSVRNAVSGMLERAGVTVVGAVSNSADALTYYTKLAPDITLIDVDLGTESGFELAEELYRAALPASPPLILISVHDEQDIADMIAASPVVGFITKTDLSADIISNLLMAAATQQRQHHTHQASRRD